MTTAAAAVRFPNRPPRRPRCVRQARTAGDRAESGDVRGVRGSILTTLVLARDLAARRADTAFTAQIAVWLWFTVLFANFAEAMAQGRGKAQADSLRAARTQTVARKLDDPTNRLAVLVVPASQLRLGDFVLCTPGDVIPGDGEVVEGVASVTSPRSPANRRR